LGLVMKAQGRITIVLLTLLALAVLPSGAAAASPIEGIWSFNGGQVAVQAQDDGTFTGTVVAPTKFSECFHPAGEVMWTEIRSQPDGSYFGLHKWYFANSDCVPNPTGGLTAWRVLAAADGSKFLRVCFSAPDSPSQPTIAPDGKSQGATFGCSDSTRISALPDVKQSEAGKYLLLPGNASCIGRKKMRIRIKDPVGDPFKRISVKLRSGKVKRRAKLTNRPHGAVAILNLRGLPRPTFVVTVRATTLLGAGLTSKRKYRLCSAPAKVRARSGTRGW
jgi:hypothetical protein